MSFGAGSAVRKLPSSPTSSTIPLAFASSWNSTNRLHRLGRRSLPWKPPNRALASASVQSWMPSGNIPPSAKPGIIGANFGGCPPKCNLISAYPGTSSDPILQPRPTPDAFHMLHHSIHPSPSASPFSARCGDVLFGGPLADVLALDGGGHQPREKVGRAGEGGDAHRRQGGGVVLIEHRRAFVDERKQG